MKTSCFALDQLSSRSPYFNLAWEEALCLCMKDFDILGGIRFWQNQNTIICGISEDIYQNIAPTIISEFESKLDIIQKFPFKLKSNTTYIARRASGGGTVYHDLGMNLNFSFFVSISHKPDLYNVQNSYTHLLGLVIKTLSKQNILSKSNGKSDLSILQDMVELKISGNAQFRKKNTIVHHGTLILNSAMIDKIENLLLYPPKEPEYRNQRKHKNFLASLPKKFEIDQFKFDLTKVFFEFMGFPINDNLKDGLNSIDKQFLKQSIVTAKKLVIEKYVKKDFIWRV